jgi:hypothetical protein
VSDGNETVNLIAGLDPPGLYKPRLGAWYRAIGKVMQQALDDATWVFHAFFPATSDAAMVKRHAQAIGIPRFGFDTDAAYQGRVAGAGYWLDRQGERGLIYEVLESAFPGRYQVLEYPRISFRLGYSKLGQTRIGGGSRIIVMLRDMLAAEQASLYAFLDSVLDPDIEIQVRDWVLPIAEPADLALIRRRGGSRWLATLLADIATVKVELLPDDGFRLATAPLGARRLYGNGLDMVLVTTDSVHVAAVMARLDTVIDASIERRVVGE